MQPAEITGTRSQVVYGADDRLEVYRATPDRIARASQSMVALIPPNLLQKVPGNGFTPDPEPASSLLQLCPDEPFAEQPSVASCSGVLIDEDLVLTAGHCFADGEDCNIYSYVFDYHYSRRDQAAISDLDVYQCRRMVMRDHSTTPQGVVRDFAIVQLDRRVDLRRVPVPFRRGHVKPGDKVTVMGFPQGLPGKIDAGGRVKPSPTGRGYWFANTDTFGGSSGSPAFDANMRLVGLLTRGRADYEEDTENYCLRAQRVVDEEEDASSSFEQFSDVDYIMSELCLEARDLTHSACDPLAPVTTAAPEVEVPVTWGGCQAQPSTAAGQWMLWMLFLLGYATLRRTR